MPLRLSLSLLCAALALAACRNPAPGDRADAAPASASAATSAPGSMPAAEPLTLVTMGASDVTGIGADDPQTEGWAPVLSTRLTGKADHVRLGSPGWTAGQIRANVLAEAVRAQPDVVVLWTGMNDLKGGVGLATFEGELGAMLAALAKTPARLYVVNMPDMDRLPAFQSITGSLRLAMPAWQRAIDEAAAHHGAVVVPLTPYSDELTAHPEYLSADGFHPSTRGYARLAGIIAGAIGVQGN
jgi:acyl-CoA thioesterase-1